MFVSVEYLTINYGIDEKIANFFVNREPPTNNLYWKGKLLYLRPAIGYLFIPLIVDLLYKTGIDKELLLSEQFVDALEKVGHISALEETEQLTMDEAIKECASLISKLSTNDIWFEECNNYLLKKECDSFKRYTSNINALYRGDIFLYSLSVVNFNEDLFVPVVKIWFALITTLLLLDDAEDLQIDSQTGDKNSILESKLITSGIKQIRMLIQANLSEIKKLNGAMAFTLSKQYEENVKAKILKLSVE